MNIMIILNYNDYETTLEYLDRIENYTTLDKIIVVDNCSPDESYNKLKKRASEKIIVIKTESNKGYASGNNYGIKYAEQKYSPRNIIISNPDIIVSENSLRKVCIFLDSHDEYAAASGLIHDTNNKIVSNFAWKLPTYKDMMVNTHLIASKIYHKLTDSGQFYNKETINAASNILNVGVLSGCFFVIKHKVFKEIGYFDERTFLYNEENILAYKLNEIGFKQGVLISERIIHFQGLSINKNIKNWNDKNKILLDSTNIYLNNYLKVSKFKLILFTLLFNIGKYEKFILINSKQKLMRRIRR
ncbi:TPA: glycosyltransferase [Streptococcus suis]